MFAKRSKNNSDVEQGFVTQVFTGFGNSIKEINESSRSRSKYSGTHKNLAHATSLENRLETLEKECKDSSKREKITNKIQLLNALVNLQNAAFYFPKIKQQIFNFINLFKPFLTAIVGNPNRQDPAVRLKKLSLHLFEIFEQEAKWPSNVQASPPGSSHDDLINKNDSKISNFVKNLVCSELILAQISNQHSNTFDRLKPFNDFLNHPKVFPCLVEFITSYNAQKLSSSLKRLSKNFRASKSAPKINSQNDFMQKLYFYMYALEKIRSSFDENINLNNREKMQVIGILFLAKTYKLDFDIKFECQNSKFTFSQIEKMLKEELYKSNEIQEIKEIKTVLSQHQSLSDIAKNPDQYNKIFANISYIQAQEFNRCPTFIYYTHLNNSLTYKITLQQLKDDLLKLLNNTRSVPQEGSSILATTTTTTTNNSQTNDNNTEKAEVVHREAIANDNPLDEMHKFVKALSRLKVGEHTKYLLYEKRLLSILGKVISSTQDITAFKFDINSDPSKGIRQIKGTLLHLMYEFDLIWTDDANTDTSMIKKIINEFKSPKNNLKKQKELLAYLNEKNESGQTFLELLEYKEQKLQNDNDESKIININELKSTVKDLYDRFSSPDQSSLLSVFDDIQQFTESATTEISSRLFGQKPVEKQEESELALPTQSEGVVIEERIKIQELKDFSEICQFLMKKILGISEKIDSTIMLEWNVRLSTEFSLLSTFMTIVCALERKSARLLACEIVKENKRIWLNNKKNDSLFKLVEDSRYLIERMFDAIEEKIKENEVEAIEFNKSRGVDGEYETLIQGYLQVVFIAASHLDGKNNTTSNGVLLVEYVSQCINVLSELLESKDKRCMMLLVRCLNDNKDNPLYAEYRKELFEMVFQKAMKPKSTSFTRATDSSSENNFPYYVYADDQMTILYKNLIADMKSTQKTNNHFKERFKALLSYIQEHSLDILQLKESQNGMTLLHIAIMVSNHSNDLECLKSVADMIKYESKLSEQNPEQNSERKNILKVYVNEKNSEQHTAYHLAGLGQNPSLPLQKYLSDHLFVDITIQMPKQKKIEEKFRENDSNASASDSHEWVDQRKDQGIFSLLYQTLDNVGNNLNQILSVEQSNELNEDADAGEGTFEKAASLFSSFFGTSGPSTGQGGKQVNKDTEEPKKKRT